MLEATTLVGANHAIQEGGKRQQSFSKECQERSAVQECEPKILHSL